MASSAIRSNRHTAARRRTRQRRTWIGAIGAVAVVGLAVAFVLILTTNGTSPTAVTVSGPARTAMLQTGDKIPDFSGPGLTGGRVSWKQFEGHPAVVEVWAPWCPHCQAELPVMGTVAPKFPGVKVVMIETAMGQEPGPSGEGFFMQHHLTFPSAVDDANGTLARAFGVRGFPTVYFVGSDGRVVDSFSGEAPASMLAQKFQELQSLEQ